MTVEQAAVFSCKTTSEIEVLCSGPMIVLCLAGEDVIEKWNRLMGPENCLAAKQSAPSSLRALYGDPDDPWKNAVDGSQSADDARHDLQFFFPNSEILFRPIFASHLSCQTLFPFTVMLSSGLSTIDLVNNYLGSVIYQQLTDALYEMTKVKPDEPLEWLAIYMLEHNANKPSIYKHSENPHALERLMKLKEMEKDEFNPKKSVEEEPAKCGCYLKSAESFTSSSDSTCCNKNH